MASPAVEFAAASTRRPEDVLAARAATLSIIPKDRNCPFCGSEPDLAQQRGEFWLVGCEADECAINPQAGSRVSAADAWAKWNGRAK